MCSDETEIYAQNTAREAKANGYQPVLIQYRGSSGVELTSPMTYGCGQYQDVNEAIEYIFDEYCREIDRKIYAIGFSMGGNWLGMALGKGKISDKIVAAACMQSPIKMRESFLNMKSCWNGFINWGLGKRYKKIFETNLDYLTPIYKQLYDINLSELLSNLSGVAEIEERLNWKVCNAKSFDDYHSSYSCASHMENIKVPTMFYYCEDDPLINGKCMNFEKVMQNDKIIMASTKYGAHLCSYEHFFKVQQWLPKPAFEFFSYFRQNEGPNPMLNRSDTSEELADYTPVALLEAESLIDKETQS